MKIKGGLSEEKMLPWYKDGHTHDFTHREEPIMNHLLEGTPVLLGYRLICICGAEHIDNLEKAVK